MRKILFASLLSLWAHELDCVLQELLSASVVVSGTHCVHSLHVGAKPHPLSSCNVATCVITLVLSGLIITGAFIYRP